MADETTRVRVVGLPSKVDIKRLKELFGGCGEVTDCAVIKNPSNGRPRMAFLGYKTNEQAAAAVKRLNKAFLGTARLTVEFAVRYGDEEANKKAWSKHTKKKMQAEQDKKRAAEIAEIEARKAEHEKQQAEIEKQNRLKKKNKEDSVKAFLEIGKASTRQIWDNDMEGPGDIQMETNNSDESDDDSGHENESEVGSLNSEEEQERQQQLNTMSDLDFFKSKQKSKSPSSPTKSPSKRPKTDDSEPAVKKVPKRQSTIQINDIPKLQRQEDDAAESKILDSGRLYVTNIPFSSTEEELREYFEKIGPVVESHVPLTRDSKQSKGVAFIQYSIPEDAVRAFKELSGACFQGRLIIISPGEENPFEKEETSNAKSSYKRMKELKQKAESGNTNAWNSVFMSGDTVAATLSKRLNVDKSELLDVNTSNIATRLAMGEAHLTTEVKDIFSQEGLDIKALTDSSRVKARSDRVILVKNLPKNTKIHDVTSLFDSFGAIERVVAPPETTIALVSYVTAQEAKVAFRKLAFRPFNKVPLFLEWAPVGALQDVNTKIKEKQREESNARKAADSDAPHKETSDTTDIFNSDKCNLYITNIAFNVTLPDLERLVKSCVSKAKYVRSINLPIDNERKCKGFAFVEFKNNKTAVAAMKQLQGKVLMQRKLSVEFTKDKKDKVASEGDCPEGCNPLKLTIKNVPFEATRKDIANLFAAFSQVKSVRLPRKAIGAADTGAAKRPHRGFAFVEFSSAQEAATAKQKLSNTHIYSRHLVIEYARIDDAVGSSAMHDRDLD